MSNWFVKVAKSIRDAASGSTGFVEDPSTYFTLEDSLFGRCYLLKEPHRQVLISKPSKARCKLLAKTPEHLWELQEDEGYPLYFGVSEHGPSGTFRLDRGRTKIQSADLTYLDSPGYFVQYLQSGKPLKGLAAAAKKQRKLEELSLQDRDFSGDFWNKWASFQKHAKKNEGWDDHIPYTTITSLSDLPEDFGVIPSKSMRIGIPVTDKERETLPADFICPRPRNFDQDWFLFGNAETKEDNERLFLEEQAKFVDLFRKKKRTYSPELDPWETGEKTDQLLSDRDQGITTDGRYINVFTRPIVEGDEYTDSDNFVGLQYSPRSLVALSKLHKRLPSGSVPKVQFSRNKETGLLDAVFPHEPAGLHVYVPYNGRLLGANTGTDGKFLSRWHFS